MFKKKKAFSMIEILVGLAVISIAALAFTPLITKQIKRNSGSGGSAECKNGIEYRTEIFDTPGVHTVNSDKDMINVYTITMVGGGGGGGAGIYVSSYGSKSGETIANYIPENGTWKNIFKPKLETVDKTDGYGTFLVGNINLEMVGAGKVSTTKGTCQKEWDCTNSTNMRSSERCVSTTENVMLYCKTSNCSNCQNLYSKKKGYTRLNSCPQIAYEPQCEVWNYDSFGPAGCSMTRTFGPEWEFATVSSAGVETTTSSSVLTGFALNSVLGGTATVKVPTVNADGTCPKPSDGGEILAGSLQPNYSQCSSSDVRYSRYGCTSTSNKYISSEGPNLPALSFGYGTGADKQGLNAKGGAIKYSYSPNAFAQAGQGGGGGGYIQFSNIIAPKTRKIEFTVGKGGAGSTTEIGNNGGDTSVYIGGVQYVAYGGMGGHYVVGNKYNWWKSQCSASTRARTDGYCSDKDCCAGDGGAVKALNGMGGDVVVGAYNQSGLGQRGRGSVGAQPYLTNYNKEYSNRQDYDFNIRTTSKPQINGGNGGGGLDNTDGGLGGCQGATNATQCIGQEEGGSGQSYSRTTKKGGGEGGGGGSCSTEKCGAGGAGGDGYIIFEYQVKCD